MVDSISGKCALCEVSYIRVKVKRMSVGLALLLRRSGINIKRMMYFLMLDDMNENVRYHNCDPSLSFLFLPHSSEFSNPSELLISFSLKSSISYLFLLNFSTISGH